jgi:hypothetical protein
VDSLKDAGGVTRPVPNTKIEPVTQLVANNIEAIPKSGHIVKPNLREESKT